MAVASVGRDPQTGRVTTDIYSHVTPELATQAAVTLNAAFTRSS
jgi:hypothetical protein